MVHKGSLRKILLIFSIIIISQISVIISFQEDFSKPTKGLIYDEAANISIFYDWNTTVNIFNESMGNDILCDIENNVYITGNIYNNSKNSYDLIALKYNNSGTLEWNKTWGGSADDYGNAIAMDSFSNIFIVGSSSSMGVSTDILIIKYNNSGSLEWYNTWGGDGWDSGYGITIDNKDNIYVIGYTESYDSLGDGVFLKYNSSGNLELNKTWGGLDTDFPTDINIDGEGNLYFTGYTSSFGAITSDFFLVKFDNNGTLLWNKTWGGILPDAGTSLIINSLNDILLAGYTQNYDALNYDIVVYNINSSGHFLWNYTYKGSGYDFGYSITLDSKENILIAGKSDENLLLLKLNSSGILKWIKRWDDNFNDIAYGIIIDDYDNIFLTGYKEDLQNDLHLFLTKYLPLPDNFEMTSDAQKPDPDGNFTLSWNESLDADNYTLYQSNKTILELNSIVIEVIRGNTNRTLVFENVSEGIYHFLVIAFNEYGNTSSNSLEINVQFPPADFILNNHTEILDTDGIANLTWTLSEGADNYSIFVGTDVINDYNIDTSLYAENITQDFFLLEDLINGDYFYVIVAYNEAGETVSNCIHVIVRRAPVLFNLTSDAGSPFDDDGVFDLIWTNSKYALNYSVFISNYSISEFNSSVIEIYSLTPPFEWPTYRHGITGLTNGTYYFVVVASNEYGSSITECIEIIVEIPQEPNNGKSNGNEIFKFLPQILIPVVLGSLIFVLIFIYNKRKKS